MAQKTRYWKQTLGLDADTMVAAGVAYTAQPDYKGFVANAVEGELGVFNAKTMKVQSGAANMPAGTLFFIALMRVGLDGNKYPQRSNIMNLANTKIFRILAITPVKQVSQMTATVPGAINKGDSFGFSIIDNTAGLEPVPRWTYNIQAKSGETWQQLLDRLILTVNSDTSVYNANKLPRLINLTRSTNDLIFTAIANNTIFSVGLRDGFTASSVAVTTPAKIGSGTLDQAQIAEDEGKIRRGVGHQYPIQNATEAEFGGLKSLVGVLSATSYNIYTYTEDVSFRSSGEQYAGHESPRRNYFYLYVPDLAADPINQLDIIFNTLEIS